MRQFGRNAPVQYMEFTYLTPPTGVHFRIRKTGNITLEIHIHARLLGCLVRRDVA